MNKQNNIKETSKNKEKKKLVSVTVKNYPDSKGGHPHIIVGDYGSNHVSVGMTKDKKKGKNNPNKKLDHNPLDQNVIGYVKRQGQVKPKKNYYGKRQGKISEADYETVSRYGQKALEKHKTEQVQKNSIHKKSKKK